MGAFLLFMLFVVVVIGMVVWWNQRRIGQLQEFADSLEGGSLHVDRGWFSDLAGASVRGRMGGRGLRLLFDTRGTGKSKTTYIQYSVTVPNAPTSFRISRADLLRKLGRWLGIVGHDSIGADRIEDKYVLRGHKQGLQRLFQNGEIERALDHLMGNLGFKEVSLMADRLVVECRLGMGSLGLQSLHRVFDALDRVASLCERRKIEVKAGRIRFGWTGGSRKVLCPYCRDDVDIHGRDVAACEACGTAHHQSCLREVGGCTIFGCAGRRVRA